MDKTRIEKTHKKPVKNIAIAEELDSEDIAVEYAPRRFHLPAVEEWVCSDDEVRQICDTYAVH